VGAVRHRQLIQLLATFVALDMAVGVVALSARRGGRDGVRITLVAGSVGIPLNDKTGTGILAGANLKERRGPTKDAGSSGSLEAAPPTRPSAPSVTTGAPTRVTTPEPPATSTSAGSQGTAASGAAPGGAATTSSSRSGSASPSRGGSATTRPSPVTTMATTRPPGSSSTTRSGPASSTTTVTRPSSTTAPAGATTTTSQPPAAGRPPGDGALTDPAGDTFVDGTGKAIKEPRADIVGAGAAYRSGFIAFVMQVQQPVDPRTDARWAADSTFAVWSVDTSGDGQPEFDIQYYAVDGQLGGVVSRPDSTDVLCGIEGAYGTEGYAAIADPACLGHPASFSYRVTLYYDTNPKDSNADVASDVTPNGGMSFPVARPN
jgi:hypothetical protein